MRIPSGARTLGALLATFALAVAGTAAAQTALTGTLARIKAAGTINVAFAGDSLPFSSLDNNNQPQGYSIDLCNRVIGEIGREVGEPSLRVNWLIGSTEDRIAMVAAGRADIDCANTSATQTRMRRVDFSSLVFIDSSGALVKTARKFVRFGDLAGRRIAVLQGTTNEAALNAMLKERLINAVVVPVRTGPEGIALLESGGVDAFVGDKVKLVGLAAQATDPAALGLMQDDLEIEPYAFAIPRNDSAYRLAVNRALSQVYRSGDIDFVFSRWLGRLGQPTALLASMYVLYAIPE
ncbi:MAG: amino acid ABC transporter substrate-binding protein [Proteobacteria bacterium]|nr:amino acid ABC transporter substrate-binding protein [Pseudomonadota bacterium]